VRVLSPAEEKAFLATLPVELLDPDDALAEALLRFGIRRVGELARLPRAALATRLGPAALPLLALAHGEPDALPIAAPREERLEEALDLEWAVDRLEPLSFVLRGLLGRLLTRLAARRLACGELDLVLGLAGGGRDARRVGVAAPSLDPRGLLGLLRLSLEARPPAGPVEQVSLATEGRPLRPGQLDLFRAAGLAPEALGRLLAELAVLCGEGRVGTPAVADDWRPGAFVLRPFQAAAAPEAAMPAADGPALLALRALRPPLAAEVRSLRGHPERLRSAVANGHVLHAAGPWRTSGAWWSSEERYAYDHYDVQTSDGSVVRLRHDLLRDAWEVDAVYD
jgi:protein ImuB